jgi:hypothetical protein
MTAALCWLTYVVPRTLDSMKHGDLATASLDAGLRSRVVDDVR